MIMIRNKCGFSLMQMMVVLLVVAVTAAASAPILTRKAPDKAGGLSPWKIVRNGSISFGSANANSRVLIGTAYSPLTARAKLYIDSLSLENAPILPQLALGAGADSPVRVFTTNENGINILSDPTTPNAGEVNISNLVRITNEISGRDPIGRVSIGSGADLKESSVVIGEDAESGNRSVVIGSRDNAQVDAKTKGGDNSVVIGANAQVNKNSAQVAANAVVLGARASITVQKQSANSQVIGQDAIADGDASVALGSASSAGSQAVALGRSSAASSAVSIGNNAIATDNSVAVGNNASTTRTQAIAIGNSALADGGIAIGAMSQEANANTQSTAGSIAIGSGAVGISGSTVALGARTRAQEMSVAIGPTATAASSASVAVGALSLAQAGSVAVGPIAEASGNNTVAIGVQSGATKDNCVMIGTEAKEENLANHIRLGRQDKHLLFHMPATKAAIGDSSNTALSDGEIRLGDKDKDVIVAGNLKFNNLDLSLMNGVIQIGNKYSTVYIPGNLVVNRHCVLGRDYQKANVWVALYKQNHDDTKSIRKLRIDPHKIEAEYGYNGEVAGFPAIIYSDRRMKNVGEVFTAGLEEIKKLELFRYTYKKDPDKTPQVGIMAQDLQKIFPTAVFKGDDGFLRIRWDEMFFALINAVKELDTKIEKTFSKYTRIAELQQQVVDLKTQNTEMKNQVSELKAMLKEMNEDLESLN